MSKPSNAKKEALADEIADELKPWQKGLEKKQVKDEIHSTIDKLRVTKFSVGTRKENKQYAEKVLATLETLVRQLRVAPKGFHISLMLRSSQVGRWRSEQTTGGLLFELLKAGPTVEQTSGLFDELLTQVVKLSEQCRAVILNPVGSDPRSDPRQYWAAHATFLLMKRLSTKEPTISSDGKGQFCTIASLLFEAVSGERECNLIRACRRVHQHYSEHSQGRGRKRMRA